MKKIKEKSAYWIRENFARYRINSMIFNLVTFLLIFVVFGFIAYVSINERIFDESKNEVVSYVEKLNSKTYDIYSKLKSPDPRMTIIYYYSDEDILPGHGIPQLDTYIVGGNEKLNEGIDLDLNGATYQKFVEEKVDGNNYLVYYTTANFPIDLIENKTHNFKTVYRVKIYMNVDGEVNSKKELIVTYAISVAFILVICIGVSYFMMQKATKPIGEFVDKHISFISDASHELRTPLAVIQSKLENIMTNLDTTIYDNLEDLAVVLNEVSRLSRLTSELLLLTRNDQNSVTLDMEIVNLDKVLEEIIEPFKEIAIIQERNLSYQGEDGIVKIDRDKIRQVMIILIDNALKYTNVNDSINIILKSIGSKVMIEVDDTGIGISEETKTRIFERFYREEKARTRENGGNGLGLSIAKTLVEAMNGEISVDHNEPKGTKFIIYFPKAK